MCNKNSEKNQVLNFLKEQGVPYKLLKHSKAVYTAKEAAQERNVKIENMLKCMILKASYKSKENFCCAIVPANERVSLKKVRKLLDCEQIRLATKEEIEEHLGLILGAISPIQLPKNVRVIVDKKIIRKKNVNMSAGTPMAGIEVSSYWFVKLIKKWNPIFSDIT